jgi:hypothetical protein
MKKLGLLALLVAGCAISYSALSQRVAMTETVYYSDAAHSSIVGYETIPCAGRVIMEGVRSSYPVEVTRILCGYPQEPQDPDGRDYDPLDP